MNVYLKYIIIWLGFMGLIAVATLLVPKIAAAVGHLRKNDGKAVEKGDAAPTEAEKPAPESRNGKKRRSILDPLTSEEIAEASAAEFEPLNENEKGEKQN